MNTLIKIVLASLCISSINNGISIYAAKTESTAWSTKRKVVVGVTATVAFGLAITAGAFATKYFEDLEFRAKLRLLHTGWLMCRAENNGEKLTPEVIRRILTEANLKPTEALINGLCAFQGHSRVLLECLPAEFYANGDVNTIKIQIPGPLALKQPDLTNSVAGLVEIIKKTLPTNKNIQALFKPDETLKRPEWI